MSIRKTFLSALMLLLFVSCLSAQNTNSPYSRFGFGTLENPALGRTRAMGGIGYGIRDNVMINPLNPASYSAVDTTNFIFDFGISSSLTQLSENGQNQTNPNGKFDHVAIKIPLKKYWGLSAGLMPFSSVGYSYQLTESSLTGTNGYVKTHEGTGGLNTVFLGSGLSLGKKLSLGANIKYTFGSLSYDNVTNFDNAADYDFYSFNSTYLGVTSFDFGLQYQTKVGKKSTLVLGGTYSPLSSFSLHENQSVKISQGKDTVVKTTYEPYEMPSSLGFGASYTYDRRLTVGFDYQGQYWNKALIQGKKDSLSNSTRIAVGMEYLPALIADSYFKAIRYRCGLNYGDSYLKYPDGSIKNAGLSLGFGLPLRGQKTALNFSFEAGKLFIPKSLSIHETYYKVSLDVSFNELWFLKRKL